MLLGLKPKDEWRLLRRLSQHDPHYRWRGPDGKPFADYIELGSNKGSLFLAAAMLCPTWYRNTRRGYCEFPAANLRLVKNLIHPARGFVGCIFELSMSAEALLKAPPGTATIIQTMLPMNCSPATGFLRVLRHFWNEGNLDFERKPWRAKRDELIGCVVKAGRLAMLKRADCKPIQEGLPL
jgi:hypothetical protein